MIHFNYSGLVMPEGGIEQGQHWLRSRFVFGWHQNIALSNVKLSSVMFVAFLYRNAWYEFETG